MGPAAEPPAKPWSPKLWETLTDPALQKCRGSARGLPPPYTAEGPPVQALLAWLAVPADAGAGVAPAAEPTSSCMPEFGLLKLEA
eukprot:11691582-Alexandrium_andersonii.AAC.1